MRASHRLRAVLCQSWTPIIGAEAGRPRLLGAKLASRGLGATTTAMLRTPREAPDHHAHALGDGSPDGSIRVQTVRSALPDR
jgi:hypothetical protein